jgi:hypothetical protein
LTEGLPIAVRWREGAATLKERFETAQPFPHLVLDDFLEGSVADGLLAEFPDLERMNRSRDYVFGDKRELSGIAAAGPVSHRLSAALTALSFSTWLHLVTGYDVFIDPRFHGGGFHQGGEGSYLDLHVDFNLHPLEPTWLRRLNILIYLNRDWDESWGGHLLIKSRPEDSATAIAPIFNRAVIMETSDRTYHGYRRITVPPGTARRSLAAYAYEEVDPTGIRRRTTQWRPEDAGVVKRVMTVPYNAVVQLKNRLLGSGTSRNR